MNYIYLYILLISGTNQLSKQIFDAVGPKLHEELKRLYPSPGVVSTNVLHASSIFLFINYKFVIIGW
jgi:hypothetical protein